MPQRVLPSAKLFRINTESHTNMSTITHTINVLESTTDWSFSSSVPQFNPALGTLTGVSLGIFVSGETEVKVESKSRLRRTVTAGSTITGTATAAGSTVSKVVTNQVSQSLAGFDGAVDFAGPSGLTQTISGNDSGSIQPSELAPFIGVGSVPVQVSASASGFYQGPADYSFQVATKAGALVNVSYEFTPAV